MEILNLIKERRSIRKYKPIPVTNEQLNQVLESARWAPSWANTQCVKFIVIKDPDMKEKLQNTLTPRNPSREAMIQAPIVIVACAETNKAGYKEGKPTTDKNEWFMFDTALALQNLTLTAHSLGLGTVHIGAFDAKMAGSLLEIPEGIVVVELIPLGHPDITPSPTPRKELKEIVFNEKYGKR
ncbi:MAG: nitroreductase family protein [bacterium]|nr:nitroreductase family protein [bacterium]